MVTSINSFLGLLRKDAPACHAISASPVASITRLAKMACLPDLLSVITPFITFPSIIASTAAQCNKGVIPASCIITSTTYLNISGSKISKVGSPFTINPSFSRTSIISLFFILPMILMLAPISFALRSNSIPIPPASTV